MILHLIFDEYTPHRPRLDQTTAWPTPRMLRRQEQVLRARKREALQLRQHFEVKMADLAQAPVEFERWTMKMVEFTVNYEKNKLSYGDLSTKKMWFYSI